MMPVARQLEADPTVWDSLTGDLRGVLAYPKSIAGAKGQEATLREEVVYLYALFPKTDVDALPDAFEYSIASLNEEIQIRRPPEAAR